VPGERAVAARKRGDGDVLQRDSSDGDLRGIRLYDAGAFHVCGDDVPHRQIGDGGRESLAQNFILPADPWPDAEEPAAFLHGDVLKEDVLETLVGVVPELEPDGGVLSINQHIPDDNVLHDVRLTAEGDHAMAETDVAMLYGDVPCFWVVCVCCRPFSTFDADAVIIDLERAVFEKYVPACVDVDAVRAGGTRIVMGRLDGDVVDSDIVAVIEMEVPESCVEQGDALYGNVGAMGDVEKAWAWHVPVGERLVFLDRFVPSFPELFPETIAVSIDDPFSCDGKGFQ